MKIEGSDSSDFIIEGPDNDTIDAKKGKDWIVAGPGDDYVKAGEDNDRVECGPGHDIAYGGGGLDTLIGHDGADLLYSDGTYGPRVIPHSQEGDDWLDGGPGKDILVAGDGADTLIGGEDGDAFVFRYHDPMVGTTHWYTTVKDFEPEHDRFVMDAGGFGDRDLFGANFINHSRGFPGEFVDTFYKGTAEGAHGEHVVVITDRGFASGAAAANAIDHEAAGDIIVYHDEETGGATLAYVDSANHANAFAHADNLEDMWDLNSLTAANFVFI
ncbi:calcium-binding protein [Rhizobium indigoferae]|uniref:Calcium-binding protein n=1 Tax=Rhizobium indigoferae TaxID=158891 RepID=A0ABZ1DQE7_9HYPH|nr:calcium-binding protein [Rhizobium indigoferae]NNU57039.1 calcium-binding protein [Rhizobium indigoferae]WRW37673.1 calcium-binding protein [Rhizobium indigoferae]GLR60326.1 hypothetical protein GCM10007919_50540 [Rhizobium indigoferae]